MVSSKWCTVTASRQLLRRRATTIDPTTADRLAAALDGLATVRAAYQEPDADLFRSFAAQVELATHGLFRPTRTAAWLLCATCTHAA